MGKQISECALCGKTIMEQQERELTEVIDGTSYTFDTNECVMMFKRFRSVYGKDFKRFLAPQEQFVSDPFWNRAIPTEQEIRDIEIEKGTVQDRPDTVQVIQDPVQIQNIAHEIGRAAKDEILIIYSSANAFHRQERLGVIQSLRETVEESGVNVRILTPKGEVIEDTVRKLKQQQQKINIRYIEPGLQTYVTIVVVDRKSSLVVELKDDTKKSSYEAMGLGTFSNRKAVVLSYVSIFESLWKQSELNEKLNELCEQLKIRDKIQTEFINIAAHELRTPIQPIMGLAEILRSKQTKTANSNMYDEYLSIIIRNARRLKDLSDNILDIARIESQSINLNKVVVDIDSVILDAVQDVTKDQSDLNQDVRLVYDNFIKKQDVPDDEIILVYIDRGRIIQVISNLICNAFNFTKKGVVSITKEKRIEDSSIIISIRDTGSGIDPQILSRLFTKFTTSSEKGTGLGLYICKRIIEAHGGNIWGKNNDGEGATFGFSLPIIKE
ncbi:MAG TPA: HAMP domain-containing sensor histidine kinase [Candidatus Nitrosopolaris sp.]|nr:HAMP domain-containing sensor histidine kinase [Candidatus Nitrosopolaris sp.]